MSGQGSNNTGPPKAGPSSSPKPLSRLPSFKPPRDLTLASGSGRPIAASLPRNMKGLPNLSDPNKKKFVPNLNVQRRDRSKEEQSKPNQQESKRQDGGNQRGQSFPPPRGRGAPNRGGGRGRPELIQTIGSVFSDGMGLGDSLRRKGGFGSDQSEGGGIERPKINLKSLDEKFDKAAEEERLKEFLRDDFIEDLTTGTMLPVQLPMIDTGKAFKEDISDKKVDKVKPVKKRPNLILDDEEDVKPDVASLMDKNANKDRESKLSELTFADLVQGQNGDLLFIQFPDHLPVSSGIDVKPQPGEISDKPVKTSIENLPEGYLGKIQILASGKTRMLIGGQTLDMEFGTQVGFLQDIVSIQTPPPNPDSSQRTVGNMTVLGRVHHRLVVTPEWTKLFPHEPSPDTQSSDED